MTRGVAGSPPMAIARTMPAPAADAVPAPPAPAECPEGVPGVPAPLPPDPARRGPPPVRKLSLSLQLPEPDAYEGGNFEARAADGSVDAEFWARMRQRGSLIIFPAAVVHRVTPVTRGERRSLVGWVLGAPSEEDLAYDPNSQGA